MPGESDEDDENLPGAWEGWEGVGGWGGWWIENLESLGLGACLECFGNLRTHLVRLENLETESSWRKSEMQLEVRAEGLVGQGSETKRAVNNSKQGN